MIKLYDTVKIIKTGQKAAVIEIDDNGGKDVPIYLLEIVDKPDDYEIEDVVFWSEGGEIEEIKRRTQSQRRKEQ